MKKAVISTGNKQYLVAQGDELNIDLLQPDKRPLSFEALLTIDGDTTKVGTPNVDSAKVSAEVIDPLVKGDKVIAIRYKPKKRVRTIRGHRQQYTRIKITKIG
ncbi:MAG TPA: 50S ribosomal protein L21 [Patescibacteria group bacterium]|nr:50S ribosomal protein L21 [Patescibacteria group bacterium]